MAFIRSTAQLTIDQHYRAALASAIRLVLTNYFARTVRKLPSAGVIRERPFPPQNISDSTQNPEIGVGGLFELVPLLRTVLFCRDSRKAEL